MFLAISAAFVLVTIVLMLLSHKMKLPFAHRVLHIRSVLVTAVLSVIAVRSFVFILDLVDRFISSSFIQKLLFRIMPQTNFSGAFFWIVTELSCLIVSAAFCAVIALMYKLWLKKMSGKTYLRRKNPVTKLLNRLSSLFYEMSGTPQTRKIFVNAGHWLRVMRNIFAAAVIAEAAAVSVYIQFELTLISDTAFSKLIKSLYMLPVVTWFLLDQIVIFLQADPQTEDIRLETEENQLSHFGDYQKLADIYKELFGGNALISDYINKNVPQESMFSGPTDEQKERVDNPELLEALCRSINNLINPLPPNFVDAIVDLINGKSIAVFDSVSGEFHLFYLAYIHHQLLLHRKALVVCDTEDQIPGIIRQFREIFLRLNKSHEIWQISDIAALLCRDDGDTDILVCTEEQFLHHKIEVKYPRFYNGLRNVFVLHAYDIMCRSNPFSFRFFDSLRKKNVQFAFLVPENSRDMDSALEVRLDGADIRLYNNYNEEAGACILCWRGESYYKTQQTFSLDLFHDFGLAYTIAIIAIKNGVTRINLHAPSDVPVRTYAATVKYYISTLAKHYFAADSISMDSAVIHNPIVAFNDKELSFDIFYDEYNNLLNVAKQALTNCAEVTSMVHIISRPYMLRDYFAYHIDKLVHNERGMQMIAPVYYQDLKAPSIALLIRLYNRRMAIEEIVSYMESFGVSGKSVEQLLTTAFSYAMDSAPATSIYSYFSFGKGEEVEFYGDEYHYTRYIRLTDENIYRSLCEQTENNIVIAGSHQEVLPVSRSCVYNRYLPGQCHSFGGERFKILSINGGEVNVQSEETVEREKEYTQIFDLPLAMLGERPVQTWEQNDHYSRDLFRIEVTRSIKGYFSHINGLDFCGDNTIRYKLSEPITETRETYCLRIRMTFPFDSSYDNAAAMMVILLRGILETAIPKNYKDILVVSRLDEGIFSDALYEEAPFSAIRRDPLPSDWLETDDSELPLKQNIMELFQKFGKTNFEINGYDFIDIYLIDFSENGKHILSGIAEDTDRLFNVLYGYLDWIIKNPSLKHCYLMFGYNQIPSIFDMTSIYSWLQRLANYSPDVSGALHDQLMGHDLTENAHCSFCGRSIAVSSWQFDDDRIMCEECNKHRTNSRKEVQVLLQQAYQTLESKYGIKLPEGIKIRFKSAASIRKASGTIFGGRVLGFYSNADKEIWVERGGPEACVMSTLLHELTHAWQFANIDADKLDLKYIEGHSTYVEIECTRELGQVVYADFLERSVLSVNNEYSQGLRYWKECIRHEADKNIFHHIQQM